MNKQILKVWPQSLLYFKLLPLGTNKRKSSANRGTCCQLFTEIKINFKMKDTLAGTAGEPEDGKNSRGVLDPPPHASSAICWVWSTGKGSIPYTLGTTSLEQNQLLQNGWYHQSGLHFPTPFFCSGSSQPHFRELTHQIPSQPPLRLELEHITQSREVPLQSNTAVSMDDACNCDHHLLSMRRKF